MSIPESVVEVALKHKDSLYHPEYRARLLAILKEPDRYTIAFHCETGGSYAFIQDRNGDRIVEKMSTNAIELEPRCIDLNARHRLKRLCEEIAAQVRGAYHAEEFGDGSTIILQDCPDKIAADILALGEPNEHSYDVQNAQEIFEWQEHATADARRVASLEATVMEMREALKTVLDRDDPAVPLSEYLVAKRRARATLASSESVVKSEGEKDGE